MDNQEKERIEGAIYNAIDEIRDILDKYEIVLRKADIAEISKNVIKVLEAKL